MDLNINIEDNLEAGGYFTSRTQESQVSHNAQDINLIFPGIKETALQRVAGKSLLIDKCIIEYSPQVPFNATGKISVKVYDDRLVGDDKLQAEFVFPVGCKIDLYYFGQSYFFANDKCCPWRVKYMLEDTNIVSGVKFCKFKAKLKLTSTKHPGELPYRPPSVKIHSTHFTEENVDYKHVARAPKAQLLCRSMSSTSLRTPSFRQLKEGVSFQEGRSSLCTTRELICPPHIDQNNWIGPSASQVNAKNYFITYPHCRLTKEDALAQLKRLNTPVAKKFIRVARELHEDGEPHLHVLIQFEGKYKCQNQRFFDLASPNASATYHPNIQGAKSSADVKEYLEKHGDFIDDGTFQADGRSSRWGSNKLGEIYDEALLAGSKEEAMQIIREKDPSRFLLQYHNISANYDRINTTPPPEFVCEYNPDSFILPAEIAEWVDLVFIDDPAARPEGNKRKILKVGGRPLSIIIEGPSRTGKTQWARSLGQHNYLSGHLDFNPALYSNEAQYNIIDDIPPLYLRVKHWKQLIGAQKNWSTNCKYGKPRMIKGGIPAIVLCNPGEGSSYKRYLLKEHDSEYKEWTEKNAKFVTLDSPLYRETTQGGEEQAQEEDNQEEED